MNVLVTDVVRDEGSVMIFQGMAEGAERPVLFVVDHRPAQGLLVGLMSGEDVEVEVDDWQVIGRAL